MLARLSTTLNRIVVFISFLILLGFPLIINAESNKYPFHMNEPIEKEVIFNYSFDSVWEATIDAISKIEIDSKAEIKKQKLEQPLSRLFSDKEAGIIAYYVSVPGNKSFFSSYAFFLRPLDNTKTKVQYHVINYVFYNQPILTSTGDFNPEKLRARRLFFPAKYSAYKLIDDILKAKSK